VQAHLLGRARRTYLRCPACGKSSRAQNFDADHELQVLTQFCVGGGNAGKGNGFVWEKNPINKHELRILLGAVERAADRLSRLLDAVEAIDVEGDNLCAVVDEAADRLALDGGSDDEVVQLKRDAAAIFWSTRRTGG
jgi:hypothetical protein